GRQAVADLEPVAEGTCAELLDGLAGRSELDASADYARHVPVAVVAHLLGVDDADADSFRAWLHDIVEVVDEPELRAAAVLAATGYFHVELERRRQQPGNDLISWLCAQTTDGQPIADETIVATALTMLLGGIDTVWTALGGILLHLAEHPADQARL